MYQVLIKPLFDVTASFLILFLISPLLLFVTFLNTLVLKGNPFFTQARPGKDGKIFRLIKFKTMNDKKDDSGKLLPDNERITTVGRILRSLSLDELPQLINVVKGDMSLVGPRPLLVKYLPLYTARQARRHEVRPGITGLAQVQGRNIIPWSDRFELDVYYVDNLSFLLDVKILWQTVLKVVKREGINTSASATMTPFTGNEKSD